MHGYKKLGRCIVPPFWGKKKKQAPTVSCLLFFEPMNIFFLEETMTRVLEVPRRTQQPVAYDLSGETLPFALMFAIRKHVLPQQPATPAGTTSDGSTSGYDGNSGGQENFDWLDDD
jgi:hypothetical protein